MAKYIFPIANSPVHSVFLILVGSNSPPLGSALIFFCYKESPARRDAGEGVRNTPLLAAG